MFPVPAGMNRIQDWADMTIRGVPCACRDEPELDLAVCVLRLCSLRLQG